MATTITPPPTIGTMASSLPLDIEGNSPSNLIENEDHTLPSKRYRALIPKKGAFYVDSVVLEDRTNNRELVAGNDYRFIVPYQSLALFYGHDIAGGILIINPAVSNKVRIKKYQAVGDDYVYNIPALQTLLSTDNNSEVSKSFLDLQNRDLQVVPTPHYHPLGDGIGFEYLVFAIEACMRCITLADNKILASMFERIDIKLQEIVQMARNRQDGELLELMNSFREDFTKERLGLGKTPNMALATQEEGEYAANPTYNVGAEINNRLVSLRALTGFRDAIVQYMVSSERTGLGETYGRTMLPTIGGIESMPNGARFIIDSMDASYIAGIPFDPQIYPDASVPSHKWAIVKVINNVTNKSAVLQAFDMSTGQMFVGIMTYPASKATIRWRRQITDVDLDDIYQKFLSHIQNTRNPHNLDASDVQLEKVENLPIADRNTILGRKPKREYMTYDGLLLFHAAYVTGDWTIDNSEDALPEQKAIARERYTTLFASAGICCGDDKLVLESAPRPTEAPVPPRGQPAGWYCEGTTKVQKITDGFGGYYLENVYSSSDCGYIAEVANYEIRDQNNGLIGRGFKAGGRIDAAATVALQNEDGVTVCFIYPTPAQGRTVSVMNANGKILGYAIEP